MSIEHICFEKKYTLVTMGCGRPYIISGMPSQVTEEKKRRLRREAFQSRREAWLMGGLG